MASMRRKPYIWVTWLTGLLAGTDRCWYKAWFKAHFQYAKKVDPEREAFFAEWTKTHDRMTQARVLACLEASESVKVEDEGAFKLEGKLATLSGKPDLVSTDSAGVVRVYDQKSGKKRDSDHWQVLLYLFALPLTWLKEYTALEGWVEYQDGPVRVRDLGDTERVAIIRALEVTGGPTPPQPVPSQRECDFCDIAECKARYTTTTEVF